MSPMLPRLRAVASWKNATGALDRAATLRGILRPAEVAEQAPTCAATPASAEPLRPFVERYWSVRWDLTGQPPFRSEVLSHPSVNVSVESGTQPRFGFPMPAVLVHGVVTRRFTVDLVGAGRVTAVEVPAGRVRARSPASCPARNGVAPLGSELGVARRRSCCAAVARRGRTTTPAPPSSTRPSPRWPPSRPAAYLDLLGARRARWPTTARLVRVDQVAALAGMSVRSLQRLFATYVGVSPKAVLARYRLQDAAAAIDAGRGRRPGRAGRLARLVRPGALQPRLPRRRRHDAVGLPAPGRS